MPRGSSCPPAYFDNVQNSTLSSVANTICQPCSSECSSCDGLLNTDCQSCRNFFIASGADGSIAQCLASCPQGGANTGCQSCHPLCDGCTGPSNQQCVACRENSTVLDLEGVRTCVPQCANGEYLVPISDTSPEHACRACHDQCLNCTGPEDTDCLQCQRVNSTVNSVSTCVESCPMDTYESETRLCQDCHVQCFGGCSGAGNTLCSACKETSVQVEGGGVACTRSCPLAMAYNSEAQSCQLTL